MEETLNVNRLVKRKKNKITGDNSRVIVLPHIPSQLPRIGNIILRVLSLSKEETVKLLKETLELFADRHRDIQQQLLRHYDRIAEYIPQSSVINKTQKLLIGAYLTMEYSIESAALFNQIGRAHV